MYSHEAEAQRAIDKWVNPHKCRKILEILDAGQQIKYEQILCESDDLATDLECKLIAEYGRRWNCTGTLTNISIGGDGGNPEGIPIDVYTTGGKFVSTHDSCAEAARSLRVSDDSIVLRCLNGYDSLKTYKGLVFVLRGEPFVYTDSKTKQVVASRDDGNLIFNGTRSAAEYFNRSTSCIRQCCAQNWQVDGYRLSYEN